MYSTINFCRSGFLREDGTFGVSGLPTGSYVVEVVNADYYYEPVRIDINSKGKMRARKVNNVQPTQVICTCFYSRLSRSFLCTSLRLFCFYCDLSNFCFR